MKKLVPLLALIFGAVPFLAVGQSEGVGPYLGATSGINMTWIIIDNELQDNEHHEAQPTFGPAPIGLALGYKFNDKNSVQLEGYLSKQGNKFDLLNSDRAVVGKKEIDLSYFAVPLLFKLSGTGTTRFNLHFGPQISFLIKGEEVNTFTQEVVVTNNHKSNNGKTIAPGSYTLAKLEPDTPEMTKFNGISPSLLLGLGVEHDLSPQWYLSANLRFNYGFTNIDDDEVLDRENDLDKYTLRYNVFGGLQIGLHYFFQEP